MKPNDITKVLDMALAARQQGKRFIPLFTGDAGLGKSEICQGWVKLQQKINPNFKLIDLRLAYMEAPDLIGLPVVENGKTKHFTPDMWPEKGTTGLLLLEEPNRAHTSVTNAVMQLLTDRKIHNYELPEGWVIAACINEGTGYDVNNMDSALRNRFVPVQVKYDHKGFLDYMANAGFHPNVQAYVKNWVFIPADQVGEEGRYISPRTWTAMNTAEQVGLMTDPTMHAEMSQEILGKGIGLEYHKFCFDQSPVFAKDLVENKKAAIKKLKEYCKPDNYAGDRVSLTVDSLVEAYNPKGDVDNDLIAEVALIISADQAVNLIERVCVKNPDEGFKTKEFLSEYPKVHKHIVTLKGTRTFAKDMTEDKKESK